jgi:hypothetical protein
MTNAMVRFSKLILLTFFAAHWMACFFYAAAYSASFNAPATWISDSKLEDTTVAEKYVNALYWTIYTMATVGYGDIRPQSTLEREISIIIMLISSSIYAYIINDISHLVSRYNMLAASYK